MTLAEQTNLLAWARRAMENAVRRLPGAPVPPAELTGNLCEPRAAFVTLKKQGELRGCIGHMDYAQPLWQNVVAAAVAAALDDPRFPPVEPAELSELKLAISVLERPVDLPHVEDFDARRHGIIVRRGPYRALLLPKVAEEYGWGEREVLECVCRKAGLTADAWRDPETKFQVFTAFDFGEP